MSITIFPFTEAELDATDDVVMAAYHVLQSRKDSLRSYLTFQSAGSFVAKDNDAVVGFGGVLDYGPFAYVGLMSVSPTVQKRGVGQLLLERLLAWLEARHCPTALLDATPVGESVYKRNGFLEDDRTVVWQQNEHVLVPRHLPLGVSRLPEAEIQSLIQFDTPQFGADRGEVLNAYCVRYPNRVLVIHDTDRAHFRVCCCSIAGHWSHWLLSRKRMLNACWCMRWPCILKVSPVSLSLLIIMMRRICLCAMVSRNNAH